MVAALQPASSGEPAAPVAIVSMPHGGCRLSVYGDGSGTLAYGATAAWIETERGALDPVAIVRELRTVARPEPADGLRERPPGSVQFGSDGQLLWFSDRDFVRRNVAIALAHAKPARMESTHLARIEQACRAL